MCPGQSTISLHSLTPQCCLLFTSQEVPAGAAAAAVNEDEMGDAAYHSMRLQSIENLAANGVSAYPHKFQATMSVPQYVQTYAHLAEKQTLNEVTVSLAGRMYRRHSSGAKLFFFDIRADGGQVQIFVDKRCVIRHSFSI